MSDCDSDETVYETKRKPIESPERTFIESLTPEQIAAFEELGRAFMEALAKLSEEDRAE